MSYEMDYIHKGGSRLHNSDPDGKFLAVDFNMFCFDEENSDLCRPPPLRRSNRQKKVMKNMVPLPFGFYIFILYVFTFGCLTLKEFSLLMNIPSKRSPRYLMSNLIGESKLLLYREMKCLIEFKTR